jgi:hypothetical protein
MAARAATFVAFCKRLGVVLSPAQRTLARVAFDRVEPAELVGEEHELSKALFGPVEVVPHAARAVLVAVCGRGSGKSYLLGALYSLWRAFTADLSTLAPGEQASALIVAPDMRLGKQCLRFAVGAVESNRAFDHYVERKTEDRLVLRRDDGALVAIEVLPATHGGSAVRGRSLVSAVLDECAFFRDESSVTNDVDVFKALAPRVLPGGLVVLASTPWIEQGLLFTEFSANFGAPQRALAVQAPAALMRPDRQMLELVTRERARDADNAARELDAEFMTGGAGVFFGPELLAPALVRDMPLASSPPVGARATIGGDIGLVADASAFVAVHKRGDIITPADVLELKPKRGAPLKLSEVVTKGCEFAERHGQKTIHVDHHVLEPAREHLPKGFSLQPVIGGQDAKTDRFLVVRGALRASNVVIPGALARLVSQLALVISRPTPGGGQQITLPRRYGTHLDLVAAFIVGAWAALRVYESGPCEQPENVRKRTFAVQTSGY